MKHFKVSVIQNTMSKATYDQNIFYTSDSELLLKFELIEKEYSYDTGEILLFNETDKSFVTRGISKVDDGFVYDIENDIIPHHGEWTGQLQLVKNGEVYTSKPFQFTIENDLSSVSPPQLIDINSWATLKQSAIDLIDDMQNVIGEYDKAATDFQQAENDRIDNEKDRKQAESTRQNHETTRQIQERVDNENQRIIDHEGRSAEFEGKADKIVFKNLVENGDFSDGLEGWNTHVTMTKYLSVTEGKAHVNLPTNTGSVIWPHFNQISKTIPGNKTYYYFEITDMQTNLDSYPAFQDRNTILIRFNKNSSYSGIEIIKDNQNLNNLYVNNALQPGQYLDYKIDNIMMIDLTQTFGAGNEPTKEEMDELIKVTGYIDGEYALNNKEMLIWTLAMIRQNKNAIIALGGTI